MAGGVQKVLGDPHGLIDQLDPERDYGSRTYEQVRYAVVTGAFQLAPGADRQPWITNAQTKMTVKGSGAPLVESKKGGLVGYGKARFLERAAEDFDEAYDELRALMKKNPNAQKLFWEMFLGRVIPREESVLPGVVKEFLDHMAEPARKPYVDGDVK